MWRIALYVIASEAKQSLAFERVEIAAALRASQ